MTYLGKMLQLPSESQTRMPTTPSPIRILASAKKKGALFTRLVSDLFLALGYDAPRLNIHKTGREIDVEARHRTEPRLVLAECKATAKPIGGDDVNKFAGAVEVERRWKPGKNLTAYFVSLSGFTESALEQERGFEVPRLVLLDGHRIAEELVHGRIIISPSRALERAGRVAADYPDLTPEDQPQLLAHKIGWIWALRFRRNAQATHVALVHADGELLAPGLAKRVLASDGFLHGDLHQLTYLTPPEPQPSLGARLEEARQAYFRYVAAECGELELEGLPADQEVGTRRLRLESLLIPLHLQAMKIGAKEERRERVERLIVGAALERRARLAILSLPGGGKTTLLKRLAVAYAFPERRSDVGDRLPNREWFPLFLRCRQLGTRAGEPITELFGQIGFWAELGDLADAFRTLARSILREGRVLLLVDGLDEIADPGLRVAFVARLRTFLSTYPGVNVVVTSREAGFRIVAGALSAHCDHYRIADFDREDIERLTVAWHREVVGDRQEVEQQARALAESIWETDRVRRLAVNPLLLTTLLLVRRWVGQLPSRRSVLYEKAIEVLLMTWNLQGFEPLDMHEVKPQLAFLAWQMMEEGAQRVSEPRLKETLREARRQMPEVLAYARMGVDEFVERVERRSGVLVVSGHTVEDGRLVPVYEFRHLTFQEYLAAQSLVDGNYPGCSDRDTIVSKLEPHFEEEAWKEVIPLVAVLAGRRAAPLIDALTARIGNKACLSLLTQCLLDEVQIPPGLLERAFEVIARNPSGSDLYSRRLPPVYLLAASRYGDVLRRVIWKGITEGTQELSSLLLAWRCLYYSELKKPPDLPLDPLHIEEIWLREGDPPNRVAALMFINHAAFDAHHLDKPGDLVRVAPYAAEAIRSPDLWEQIAGAWALAWLAEVEVFPPDLPSTIRRLLELWKAGAPGIHYFAAWALGGMPLLPRGEIQASAEQEIALFEPQRGDAWRRARNRIAGLIALYYAGLEAVDLVERINIFPETLPENFMRNRVPRGLRDLLGELGEDGEAVLRHLEERVAPKAGRFA